MPLIVKLVIRGQPVPLQIVVAPLAAINGVGHNVDAVVAAIRCIAYARSDARSSSRILQEGCTRIERVAWEQIGEMGTFVPRHRVAANTIPQLQRPVLIPPQAYLHSRLRLAAAVV